MGEKDSPANIDGEIKKKTSTKLSLENRIEHNFWAPCICNISLDFSKDQEKCKDKVYTGKKQHYWEILYFSLQNNF